MADLDKEFPPDRVEYLQTPRATIHNLPGNKDTSPGGHSTCTASKAAGQRWGAAKKSKLVVVKMTDLDESETETVFDVVWKDIKKKQRQKKSVVTISWGTKQANSNNRYWRSAKSDIQNLLNNDVIVVCAAGNSAQSRDDEGNLRKDVDTAPAVYSGSDFPLIVIGAVDNAGNRAAFSQGGPRVKTHAPGVKVECANSLGTSPRTDSGTSFCKSSTRLLDYQTRFGRILGQSY